MGAAFLINRVWPSRKDNSLGRKLELRELLSAGEHLGEDIELAETSSDPFTFMVSLSNPES
jgi:hypothetical protein